MAEEFDNVYEQFNDIAEKLRNVIDSQAGWEASAKKARVNQHLLELLPLNEVIGFVIFQPNYYTTESTGCRRKLSDYCNGNYGCKCNDGYKKEVKLLTEESIDLIMKSKLVIGTITRGAKKTFGFIFVRNKTLFPSKEYEIPKEDDKTKNWTVCDHYVVHLHIDLQYRGTNQSYLQFLDSRLPVHLWQAKASKRQDVYKTLMAEINARKQQTLKRLDTEKRKTELTKAKEELEKKLKVTEDELKTL